MEFTIQDMQRTTENRGLLSRDMQEIVTATIKVADHGTYFVSRWHDETAWVADAHIGDNGFPHYSHNTGSRITALRGFDSDSEIGRALDAQLASLS